MIMRRLKRIAIGFGLCFVVLFGVAGALATFCHPDAPKALASVTDPFAKMDLSGLPRLVSYRARAGQTFLIVSTQVRATRWWC
jgi:hypothetical protein